MIIRGCRELAHCLVQHGAAESIEDGRHQARAGRAKPRRDLEDAAGALRAKEACRRALLIGKSNLHADSEFKAKLKDAEQFILHAGSSSTDDLKQSRDLKVHSLMSNCIA